MLSFFLSGILLLAMTLCVLLNLAALPGNWAAAALAAVWSFFVPGHAFDTTFFIMLTGLALLGEILEFGTQIWGARKYGSSKISTAAGILGAIAGAFAGAPFMFGIGAVAGALFGSWGGCYLAERIIQKQPSEVAFRSAQGALIGRFLGMVIKLGFGVAMLALTASYICALPSLPPMTNPVML